MPASRKQPRRSRGASKRSQAHRFETPRAARARPKACSSCSFFALAAAPGRARRPRPDCGPGAPSRPGPRCTRRARARAPAARGSRRGRSTARRRAGPRRSWCRWDGRPAALGVLSPVRPGRRPRDRRPGPVPPSPDRRRRWRPGPGSRPPGSPRGRDRPTARSAEPPRCRAARPGRQPGANARAPSPRREPRERRRSPPPPRLPAPRCTTPRRREPPAADGAASSGPPGTRATRHCPRRPRRRSRPAGAALPRPAPRRPRCGGSRRVGGLAAGSFEAFGAAGLEDPQHSPPRTGQALGGSLEDEALLAVAEPREGQGIAWPHALPQHHELRLPGAPRRVQGGFQHHDAPSRTPVRIWTVPRKSGVRATDAKPADSRAARSSGSGGR